MAPRKDATAAPSASQTQQDASSDGIEDFEISKILVTQLAKSALPKDAKLEDDSITALVKGSTVFINYLSTTAQEIAASRAHKTISGADVLKALEVLEFGELANAFQIELEAFRQGSKTDKGKSKVTTDSKGKVTEKSSPAGSTKSATAQPATDEDQNISGARLFEAEINNYSHGGAVLQDVEMRDVREGVLPVNVVKPVTLPIE